MSLAQDLDDDEAGFEPLALRHNTSFADRLAEAAVAELLTALGRDLDDPNLADTPRRVAATHRELLHREP
jgi:GTP cyclohydrolase I